MVSFSSSLLDAAFATDLSKLTECGMPELRLDDLGAGHWLTDYVLNTIFIGGYDAPFRQIAYAYMRRAEACAREYAEARQLLGTYVAGKREDLSLYAACLYHIEQHISQAYLAYMLLRHMLCRKQLFNSGDHSELDRLNRLYNSIKRADERLIQGKYPAGAPTPLWLTNSGVRSADSEVTFVELHDMVRDLANGAKRFGNPKAVVAEPAPPGS